MKKDTKKKLVSVWVTMEPIDGFPDDLSATFYFRVGDKPTVKLVREYIVANAEDHYFQLPRGIGLSLDLGDLTVLKSDEQPFPEYVRFLAGPCV